MRVLVIGSAGMLGHITTLYLAEKGHDVWDISKTEMCRKQTDLVDVCNEESIRDYLDAHSFDVVINCAALLVRACEGNEIRAKRVNAEFPHWLERYYSGTKTKVIQVSTAGVFRGDNAPYGEFDTCDADGIYSLTKIEGELYNPKDVTIRSDFWGPDQRVSGIGMFNWLMTRRGEISGFSKVIINGVSTLEFAKFIEKKMNNSFAGVYHLHSGESISKADLLKMVCDVFKLDKITVKDTDKPKRDTSLKTNTKQISYEYKNYMAQLQELKEWIDLHKEIYAHYF